MDGDVTIIHRVTKRSFWDPGEDRERGRVQSDEEKKKL